MTDGHTDGQAHKRMRGGGGKTICPPPRHGVGRGGGGHKKLYIHLSCWKTEYITDVRV